MVEKGPPLGGLVVKTPNFKSREREFDLRSHMPHNAAKKKKKVVENSRNLLDAITWFSKAMLGFVLVFSPTVCCNHGYW